MLSRSSCGESSRKQLDVQLSPIPRDEFGKSIVHEAQPMSCTDRLREGVDLLIPHLLVDVSAEQARGELRVQRLFDDECGGRLDGKLVELSRGRTVIETADGRGLKVRLLADTHSPVEHREGGAE